MVWRRYATRLCFPTCPWAEAHGYPDIATEQTNILRWLSGDTNYGQWRDASLAWKHLFVLRSGDLTEAFTVPNEPADGCGSPAPPPVVDGDGRVLAWFKTASPTLTAKDSFGTPDRCSIPETAIGRPSAGLASRDLE